MLAEDMLEALAANPAVFQAPPVAASNLQTAMAAYITARDPDVAAPATAAKDEPLQALTDDMKGDLRYPETTVNYDDQLKLIGWCGGKAKTLIEALGQCRTLEAPCESWAFLDRKESVVVGAVAAYKMECRLRPDGPWCDAGMAGLAISYQLDIPEGLSPVAGLFELLFKDSG